MNRAETVLSRMPFPRMFAYVVSDYQRERLNLISSFLFQLAEYRQRKAYADSQKKQKKKKKKKSSEEPEGDSQERVEVCVGGEESSGGGQDGSQKENKDPPSSEFTFTGVLQSGETVKHHQKYAIEVGCYPTGYCWWFHTHATCTNIYNYSWVLLDRLCL